MALLAYLHFLYDELDRWINTLTNADCLLNQEPE